MSAKETFKNLRDLPKCECKHISICKYFYTILIRSSISDLTNISLSLVKEKNSLDTTFSDKKLSTSFNLVEWIDKRLARAVRSYFFNSVVMCIVPC